MRGQIRRQIRRKESSPPQTRQIRKDGGSVYFLSSLKRLYFLNPNLGQISAAPRKRSKSKSKMSFKKKKKVTFTEYRGDGGSSVIGRVRRGQAPPAPASGPRPFPRRLFGWAARGRCGPRVRGPASSPTFSVSLLRPRRVGGAKIKRALVCPAPRPSPNAQAQPAEAPAPAPW